MSIKDIKTILTETEIKHLALINGFSLRKQEDGSLNLNPYVYKFAEQLIQVSHDALLNKLVLFHMHLKEAAEHLQNRHADDEADVYLDFMKGCHFNLDYGTIARLHEAARKSNWIPPEYYMNDWVSDCATFLKEGPQAFIPDVKPQVQPLEVVDISKIKSIDNPTVDG
jgi:hypothetical protein